MSISKEVNEIISCCSGTITPLTRPHTPTSVCTHCEQKRNPHPLLPRALLTPPSRPAQTDQNFPWVAAQRYGAALARSPALPESWVARCLFPSPPFPDPNRDVSGSAWEGLDLPGIGGGDGGGDDSIFQVFGVSELGPVQPLTALAPSKG